MVPICWSLYVDIISMCDVIMEDKKCTRNIIKLLQVIKELMYLNGSKVIHMVHNQVMATNKCSEWGKKEVNLPRDSENNSN